VLAEEEFILAPKPDQMFVRSLPYDNPWVGTRYIELMEARYRNRPELLKAYRDGSWMRSRPMISDPDAVDRVGEGQAWTEEHISDLIAVDCARFGDEETCIVRGENTRLVEHIVMP